MNIWTLTMATSQEHTRDLRRETCERRLAERARCENARATRAART
jgi:hypothetical protein